MKISLFTVVFLFSFLAANASRADAKRHHIEKRKIIFECKNPQGQKLTVYDHGDEKAKSFGYYLDFDPQRKPELLVDSSSRWRTVKSEVYQFEGFMKIKQNTSLAQSDTRETVIILIDRDENDENRTKYRAHAEVFSGKDAKKKIHDSDYDCIKNLREMKID